MCVKCRALLLKNFDIPRTFFTLVTFHIASFLLSDLYQCLQKFLCCLCSKSVNIDELLFMYSPRFEDDQGEIEDIEEDISNPTNNPGAGMTSLADQSEILDL